jgi:hypothetical protein
MSVTKQNATCSTKHGRGSPGNIFIDPRRVSWSQEEALTVRAALTAG